MLPHFLSETRQRSTEKSVIFGGVVDAPAFFVDVFAITFLVDC